MKVERITQINHPLYKTAMDLYHISFPYHEQREALSQSLILENRNYHFDVFFDQNQFIGEALYWEIEDYLYIKHLCVNPDMRNKHYGQQILNLLQVNQLILEINPTIDEISRRKKSFYERCGFMENPYHHVHPSYHHDYSGHELIVMSSPKKLC